MLIVIGVCAALTNSDAAIKRFWPFIAMIFIFAIFRNLQIIWNGRHRIFATVEAAALEATASAIEFRQKADARVLDRAKERIK